MGTHSGEATLIHFLLCLPSIWWSLLKDRKSIPLFGRIVHLGKQKGRHKVVCLKKHGSIPAKQRIKLLENES